MNSLFDWEMRASSLKGTFLKFCYSNAARTCKPMDRGRTCGRDGNVKREIWLIILGKIFVQLLSRSEKLELDHLLFELISNSPSIADLTLDAEE